VSKQLADENFRLIQLRDAAKKLFPTHIR
jgi:hypothetical protein